MVAINTLPDRVTAPCKGFVVLVALLAHERCNEAHQRQGNPWMIAAKRCFANSQRFACEGFRRRKLPVVMHNVTQIVQHICRHPRLWTQRLADDSEGLAQYDVRFT